MQRFQGWLYGMCLAASAWEQECSSKMDEFSMKRGRFAPALFYGVERELRCVARVGDVTCVVKD